MIEELDGLSVQGEVIGVLIVEEVDGVLVQPKGKGLQEGDIIRHHLVDNSFQNKNAKELSYDELFTSSSEKSNLWTMMELT